MSSESGEDISEETIDEAQPETGQEVSEENDERTEPDSGRLSAETDERAQSESPLSENVKDTEETLEPAAKKARSTVDTEEGVISSLDKREGEERAESPSQRVEILEDSEDTVESSWKEEIESTGEFVRKSGDQEGAEEAVQPPAEEMEGMERNQDEVLQSASSSVPGVPSSANEASVRRREEKHERISFSSYIYLVLKEIHPDLKISMRAMSVMNNLIGNIFEKIVNRTNHFSKINDLQAISSCEIQRAIRLAFENDITVNASASARQSVAKYVSIF